MAPFKDISWSDARDNMPGIVGDIYFIPTSEIDVSACTVEDDGVTITGSIALQVGGRINKIYAIDRSGNVTDENQGDIDGSYSMNTLVWAIPGSTKDSAEFKRKVRNTRGVFLFKDSDFNFRVVGLWLAQNPKWTGAEDLVNDQFVISTEKPAYTAPAGKHGQSGGDRKDNIITVTCDAPHEPPFYDGDLPVNA